MSEEGAQGLWNPLSQCLGGLSGRGDFTTLLASVRVRPFPGDLVSAGSLLLACGWVPSVESSCGLASVCARGEKRQVLWLCWIREPPRLALVSSCEAPSPCTATLEMKTLPWKSGQVTQTPHDSLLETFPPGFWDGHVWLPPISWPFFPCCPHGFLPGLSHLTTLLSLCTSHAVLTHPRAFAPAVSCLGTFFPFFFTDLTPVSCPGC